MNLSETPIAPATDSGTVDATASKIISAAHALGKQTERLPDLIDNNGPSWLDRLIQKIFGLLGNSMKNTNFSWLGKAFLVLVVILAIAIIVLLVYFIGRYAVRASQRPKFTSPPVEPDNFEVRSSKLEDEISALLKNGEVAKAARLRWRLHLERKQREPSFTPLELFQNQKVPTREWMTFYYRLMFSGTRGSPADYEGVRKELSDLE